MLQYLLQHSKKKHKEKHTLYSKLCDRLCSNKPLCKLKRSRQVDYSQVYEIWMLIEYKKNKQTKKKTHTIYRASFCCMVCWCHWTENGCVLSFSTCSCNVAENTTTILPLREQSVISSFIYLRMYVICQCAFQKLWWLMFKKRVCYLSLNYKALNSHGSSTLYIYMLRYSMSAEFVNRHICVNVFQLLSTLHFQCVLLNPGGLKYISEALNL